MDAYLESFKDILTKVQDEIKKLHSKQEELKKREQYMLTIKENTTKIVQLLQGKGVTSVVKIIQEQKSTAERNKNNQPMLKGRFNHSTKLKK